MSPIEFNSEKYEVKLEYASKPVINIIRANFLTNDPIETWHGRLTGAVIAIKIAACEKNGALLDDSPSGPIALGQFIHSYFKQPVLDINWTFRFEKKDIDFDKVSKWAIIISISHIQFKEREILSIQYSDSDSVSGKAKIW